MGIKLDWNIEAEQGKQQQHREDRTQRRQRHRAFMRFLFFIAIILAACAALIYVVFLRWQVVNDRLEGLLVDTVQTEIAALRVGNYENFIDLQRSANENWLQIQSAAFEDYQALKATSDVILSGRVVDVAIDGQRGRVQVEEIIDGIPYVQTWFYWRYGETPDDPQTAIDEGDPGGWHHVPPDYTFWGARQTLQPADKLTIIYNDLDAPTAQQLADQMTRWLTTACEAFICDNRPAITVTIDPQYRDALRWQALTPVSWQMILSSPYVTRARLDQPFDIRYQVDIATLLAEQLIDQRLVLDWPETSDAAFLRSSTITWLAEQFLGVPSGGDVVSSLATTYGETSVQTLLQNLTPVSDLTLLAATTGSASVPQMSLNWHDFILWRLQLEDALIGRGDESAWAQLYNFRDEAIRAAAYSRYNANQPATAREIINVVRDASANGVPQLVAQVRVTRDGVVGDEIIVFDWNGQTWQRVN